MHYHSQNLTGGRLPKIVNGRAWLHLGKPYESKQVHCEWGIGKYASGFAAKVSFGTGDDDAGILFHFCVPWLFSIFFGWDGFKRCKECSTGVAIHSGSIWFYPLALVMDSPAKDDPWYRHTYCWHFPWTWDWWSTEICEHARNDRSLKVVWSENSKTRKPFLEGWDERKAIERSVSKDYPYSYILKNRKIQNRTATVHVSRMTHRARWWPFIPLQKTRTYIDVSFSQEVGEETGFWKGGCTGCSYEMKWEETPERCLSRMEHEREFRR